MSSVGSLDIASAQGALRSLGFFYSLETEQTYDYMFEECRHTLMNLDSALCDEGRLHLRPLIDGLTALHVGCSEPVGTGVLWAGARGVHSYQDWLHHFSEEHVSLMRALPNLLLLCRPAGAMEKAAHFLRDLLQRGFEDPVLCHLVLAVVLAPQRAPAAAAWL